MGGVVLEGLCTGKENTEIKLHCCEPEASSVAVLAPFKHSSALWVAPNPSKNLSLMSNSYQNTSVLHNHFSHLLLSTQFLFFL